MPGAGVEPARYHYRGILSPLRLPISPSGHRPRMIAALRLLSRFVWFRRDFREELFDFGKAVFEVGRVRVAEGNGGVAV